MVAQSDRSEGSWFESGLPTAVHGLRADLRYVPSVYRFILNPSPFPLVSKLCNRLPFPDLYVIGERILS